MEKIVKYLSCGYISIRGDIVDFHVTKYSDVAEKIIPFFAKYPILGVKTENLNDFNLVAALINNKEHLTVEGAGFGGKKLILLKENQLYR